MLHNIKIGNFFYFLSFQVHYFCFLDNGWQEVSFASDIGGTIEKSTREAFVLLQNAPCPLPHPRLDGSG